MINTSAFDRVLYLNLTQDNTLSLAERSMERYSGCQESYCFVNQPHSFASTVNFCLMLCFPSPAVLGQMCMCMLLEEEGVRKNFLA